MLPMSFIKFCARNILQGDFATGQQLRLSELESKLGISRSPLKAALARLQAEGLVTIHPRRGTYVTEYDTHTILKNALNCVLVLEAQALRITRSIAQERCQNRVDTQVTGNNGMNI